MFASFANAQDFPRLEPNQFVYGIPSGYVNPSVSTQGAQQINEQLQRLHYPFFVIFLDRLPDDEDVNVEATQLLENLMQAWRTKQPNLCPPEASAFLQITNPRKYRLTAGSRWVTQLNLGAEQITVFGARYFVPFMRQHPDDPISGILATTREIDRFVFEQTDPAFLGQQQEAETLRAEEARRAIQARPEHRDVQAPTNAQRAEPHPSLFSKLKWATLSLLILTLLILTERQRRKVVALRAEHEEKLAVQQRLLHEAGTHLAIFNQIDREILLFFMTKQGRTGALSQEVTRTIDEIRIFIEAMRVRQNECVAMGARGWLFNADPLRNAIRAMDTIFTYKMVNMPRTHLFKRPIDEVEINPARLESDLTNQIEIATAGWSTLQEAHNIEDRDPRKDLPLDDLARLQARATEGHLPSEWQQHHPLANNPEEIYAHLTALRSSDAVAYCEEIKRLQAQAREANELVNEIIKLIEPIFGQIVTVTIPEGTVVDVSDSPSPHSEAAKRGEGELVDMLKALCSKTALQSKIETILRERTEAAKKAKHIHLCIDTVDGAIEAASIQLTNTLNERTHAERRIGEVREIHFEIDETCTVTGYHLFKQGKDSLAAADLARTHRRHVAAHRLTVEATKHLQGATAQFAQTERYCNALDQSVVDANTEIQSGAETHRKTLLHKEQADQRVTDAGRVHARIYAARRYIEQANTHIDKGEDLFRQARTAITEKRFVKAKSLAADAIICFREASTALREATHWCDEQDQLKIEYEAFVAQANSYRRAAVNRISKTDRIVSLAIFHPSSTTGPTDFAAALAEAVAICTSWDQAAHRAELEYAEELREAKAASLRAEAAQRRAKEAALNAQRHAKNAHGHKSGGGDRGGNSSVGGGDY